MQEYFIVQFYINNTNKRFEQKVHLNLLQTLTKRSIASDIHVLNIPD